MLTRCLCVAFTVTALVGCGSVADPLARHDLPKGQAPITGPYLVPRSPIVPRSPFVPRSPIVAGSQQDLVVNVGDRVFFGYDRFDLSDGARATLDQQFAWLLNHPRNRLVIEGHCDERGTREYNLALGARRAEAVRTYLLNAGIAADRLVVVSYGKDRPVNAGISEVLRQQNRRAVSVLAQ